MLKNYTHKITANGCRKTQPSLSNWKEFLAAAVTVSLNIQDILCLKVVDDAFLVIYPRVINVATGSGKGFIYHSGNRTIVLQRLLLALTKRTSVVADFKNITNKDCMLYKYCRGELLMPHSRYTPNRHL